MSKIDDLINRIEDEELQSRIREEVRKLKKQKKFGLVFEEHLPEATPLYDVPIKQGSTVVKRDGDINDVYYVSKIEGDTLHCIRLDKSKEEVCYNRADVVTVSRFGQPIFPFVKPLDHICNAPDSDLWHILIESDNYHALQLLVYLYGGKVDCIYIDPPYNTGAKDWKYNNDYVDSNDSYRHSKWLSFMEHRLRLAKRLLNPKSSVLIVTIDEKEYHHLACLLEETFTDGKIQMVSTVINHAGNGRQGDFCRTNEFIYFITFGEYELNPIDDKVATSDEVVWDTLRRHNPASVRPARPSQFYPIYISLETKKIVKIGEPITPDVDRFSVPSIEGCATVFPVKDNGVEMMWGVVPEECRRRNAGGYIKIGKYNPKKPQQFPIQMLSAGTIRDIEKGKVKVVGKREDGSVIAIHPHGKKVLPKTQWDKETHDARYHGTELIRKIIGDRFSYPKSIYAVKDCLYLFTANKPNALILDFFAGSGTTLHAVNLLNAEDGGHRRCIMVTNNEISNEESRNLRKQGFKQGDKEWEMLGIARYVTWPRTVCSIKGQNINGVPLQGTYLGSDIPMADGFKSNAIFFKLGFLDKNEVALGRNLKELLPLLWMKANAIGECPALNEDDDIPEMIILPKNKMAILIDEDCYPKFREEVNSNKDIKTVFIISNSEEGYREMISRLNVKQTYQLYRDYLDNFTLNNQ